MGDLKSQALKKSEKKEKSLVPNTKWRKHNLGVENLRSAILDKGSPGEIFTDEWLLRIAGWEDESNPFEKVYRAMLRVRDDLIKKGIFIVRDQASHCTGYHGGWRFMEHYRAIDVCSAKFSKGSRLCYRAHEDSGYINLKELSKTEIERAGVERTRMGTVLLAIRNSEERVKKMPPATKKVTMTSNTLGEVTL